MNTVNSANAFDLKCLSLNVRGLNKSIKRRTVFRWLHKQKHHVIFLQESYCSKELEPTWENEWGGKAFFSHRLNQQLEEFAQDTIVIGGDFNCALTSNDKRGGKPVSKKSAVIQEINTLCDLYNLSDIW